MPDCIRCRGLLVDQIFADKTFSGQNVPKIWHPFLEKRFNFWILRHKANQKLVSPKLGPTYTTRTTKIWASTGPIVAKLGMCLHLMVLLKFWTGIPEILIFSASYTRRNVQILNFSRFFNIPCGATGRFFFFYNSCITLLYLDNQGYNIGQK